MKQKLKLFLPEKAPNHRQKRISEELRHCLSELFLRGDIPPQVIKTGEVSLLPTSVTVTYVSVAADLSQATIFFMPLGGEKQKETLEFLTLSSGYFRKQVAKKINLRLTPKIVFKIDDQLIERERIDNLIKGIQS